MIGLRMFATLLALGAALGMQGAMADPPLAIGPWRAWLDAQKQELPFGLELQREAGSGAWRAVIVNGEERIDVSEVDFADGTLTIPFPHYDSVITATASADGTRIEGAWRKRRNADEWPELLFHATAGEAPRFAGTRQGAPEAGSELVAGRWSVRFASDEQPAVGEFRIAEDGSARGTFLTTTGDHRFLAGRIDRERAGPGSLVTSDDGPPRIALRLSAFDGSHAFLYSALLQPDGTLAGDFWSGGRFHDTWTAVRDEHAALPDAFSLTRAVEGGNVDSLGFPDLDGRTRKLSAPEFAGKLRLIELFGSWCPNCADEARELAELQRTYGPRGLTVLGLAFELTGDLARDAELVRRYAARHGASWPMLLAGVQDRQKASASLAGVIDGLRAWPTTLFVDATGQVRAVYTGWNGPATGEANVKQRAQITALIEKLLAE